MVLWSAQERGNLYGYRLLPWPLEPNTAPEHWPADVARYWLQAQRAKQGEEWDAAALMTRSALQLALRHHEAAKGSLRSEIDDLASQGLIPPLMKEWAHALRLLGNDSAHPEPGGQAPDPDDVRDALKFLDFLLEYLYDLPKQIDTYRERRDEK